MPIAIRVVSPKRIMNMGGPQAETDLPGANKTLAEARSDKTPKQLGGD